MSYLITSESSNANYDQNGLVLNPENRIAQLEKDIADAKACGVGQDGYGVWHNYRAVEVAEQIFSLLPLSMRNDLLKQYRERFGFSGELAL